jgi:hypothetical protein
MNHQKTAKGESHKMPKKFSHLEAREGENGGHVMTHHFDNSMGGDYHKPEEHVFGAEEGDHAMEHFKSAMNIKTSEPSEAEGEETGDNEEA